MLVSKPVIDHLYEGQTYAGSFGRPFIDLPIPAGELTWPQRIDHYARETGYPGMGEAFTICNGICYGWISVGNSYGKRPDGEEPYYGAYPGTYLKRVHAIFFEKQRVFHLFSGTLRQLPDFPGDTCDVNPDVNPTFIDDAHTLSTVPLEDYDLVLADPPYSEQHAERYGYPMPDSSKVLRTLRRVRPGSHVAWLDQRLPMYRKADWQVEAHIAVRVSTKHVFRVISVFRRLQSPDEGE